MKRKGFLLIVVAFYLSYLNIAAASAQEMMSVSTGLCLDVAGGNRHTGAPIQLFVCHGGDNQQFAIIPLDGTAKGESQIINQRSGLCLNATHANSVTQERCDLRGTEIFSLAELDRGKNELGEFRLISGDSGSCVALDSSGSPEIVNAESCRNGEGEIFVLQDHQSPRVPESKNGNVGASSGPAEENPIPIFPLPCDSGSGYSPTCI